MDDGVQARGYFDSTASPGRSGSGPPERNTPFPWTHCTVEFVSPRMVIGGITVINATTLAGTLANTMTSKAMILYATREGQTRKVAVKIAAHLADSGLQADVVDVSDPDETGNIHLDNYDQLIFGASMHAGGIENELAGYINRHKEAIETKTCSFFLVLLSAASKDPELRREWLADAREKVSQQLNISFDEIEMVAGALMYSKYPLPVKWLMKSIARKAGEDTDTSRDYEYTDWEQVRRYAQMLASR